MTNDNNDTPNHNTGMIMHCAYLPTTTTTNPTL